VISQVTAARLSWPLWSQPLGAGHLLPSVSYGSELFEAGSGGLRLLCRRTGRSGRPDAMPDILGVLAGQGIGPGLVLLVGGQFGAPAGAAGPDSLLLVPEAARMIAVSVGAEPCGVPAGVVHVGGGHRALLRLLDEQARRPTCRRVPAVDEDPAWILRETRTSLLRPRVTESLFTLGAGGLATRGVGGGSGTSGAADGAGGWRVCRDGVRSASAVRPGLDRSGWRACSSRRQPGAGPADRCPGAHRADGQRLPVAEPAAGQHHPVGLDYSIWPGQSCGLGSSLSDLLGRVLARVLPARLHDGAGPA